MTAKYLKLLCSINRQLESIYIDIDEKLSTHPSTIQPAFVHHPLNPLPFPLGLNRFCRILMKLSNLSVLQQSVERQSVLDVLKTKAVLWRSLYHSISAVIC